MAVDDESPAADGDDGTDFGAATTAEERAAAAAAAAQAAVEAREALEAEAESDKTDEEREADRQRVLEEAEERAAAGVPLVEGHDFLLEARAITAGYVPGVDILNGCEVELRQGEMIGIIGPNGAGKSTLIKALFGLLDITKGTITLRGQDITGHSAHQLVREGIGYVPQRENVFPRLTVEENLEMGVYQRPESFDAQKERLIEMFPRLGERLGQRAGLLSGGERQMLAMARALTMEPSVLLLDEPSAGLSPALQDDVFERTKQVNEAGVSVIMVEQNARRCLQICDRGYVLDQGQNAYTDTGQALLEDPKVIELYLGTLARAD